MAKIAILVTSDVVSDQRVHRTASTLADAGHNIWVIGRRLKNTPSAIDKPYKLILFRLPFKKGFLFYASYNIWAFTCLIFRRFDLFHANDLDTLPAARMASLIKNKPIIYDSHELFTEVPELLSKPNIQRIWVLLEKLFSKGINFNSTVSDGIANELNKRYKKQYVVIRNVPYKKHVDTEIKAQNSKTVIYQGALNIGRGLEKLIEAMQWLPDARLMIVGSGDIELNLKRICNNFSLDDRVTFTGRVNLEQLHDMSINATLGVSLEEDFGTSYRFALPNKLFDYIQAGLPVLTSNLPEMEKIVKNYSIGKTIENNCTAKELAFVLNEMLNDSVELAKWKLNSLEASRILCWENEREKLISLVYSALKNK